MCSGTGGRCIFGKTSRTVIRMRSVSMRVSVTEDVSRCVRERTYQIRGWEDARVSQDSRFIAFLVSVWVPTPLGSTS